MKRVILCLALISMLIPATVPPTNAAPAEPTEPLAQLQSEPSALVADEPIDGFTLRAARLF